MAMSKIALENWLRFEMRKINDGMNFSLIDFEPYEGGLHKGFIVIRFISKMFATMKHEVRHKIMEDLINNQFQFISKTYTFMHEEATPEELIN